MSHTIETTYGNIAYIDNKHDGQPLLFIHGNSSCKEVFVKQFESTGLNKYRLLAADLPAHGSSVRSNDPQSTYTIGHYARLIREFCDLLELENPIIIGWSLGGHIAIEALAQGLNAKGLLITGTPPFGPGLESVGVPFHQTEHMALTGKAEFSNEDAYNYACATLGSDQFVTDHLLNQVKACDGRFRETMLSDWSDAKAGHSAIEFVESTSTPIAVIQGKNDPFVNLEFLQSLNWNSLWSNNVVILDDAGHAPFIEKPFEFNEVLTTFADSLLEGNPKKYRIGIIGFGGVSQAMTKILSEKSERYKSMGLDFSIVAVSDQWKGFAINESGLNLDQLCSLPNTEAALQSLCNGSKTANNEAVITSEFIDVVIETTFTNPVDGEPGLNYCRQALSNAKHVITTNKGPVAFGGKEFSEIAKQNNRRFLYEGSVMSGTPALNLLSSCLQGCNISKVSGILNGTSNFILTQMEEGLSFDDALSLAQQKGYAENDPTADIGGSDVALKILILARQVLNLDVSYTDINIQGIIDLTLDDVLNAKKEGYRWKLIGSCDENGNATVKPVKLPISHALASIGGATNALLINTDHLGEVCVSGPGAGLEETGYALITDLLSLAK